MLKFFYWSVNFSLINLLITVFIYPVSIVDWNMKNIVDLNKVWASLCRVFPVLGAGTFWEVGVKGKAQNGQEGNIYKRIYTVQSMGPRLCQLCNPDDGYLILGYETCVVLTTWKTSASWPVVRTIWGWRPDCRKKPWADTVQPPLQWGRWERKLVSDRDTVDPHWEGPAVSVSSLATRHLLLVSSCCKTNALICLSSSPDPLSHSPSLSLSRTFL